MVLLTHGSGGTRWLCGVSRGRMMAVLVHAVKKNSGR